jgi:hypothetical protein
MNFIENLPYFNRMDFHTVKNADGRFVLIRQGLPQGERLVQLNNTAITQMRSLTSNKNLKRLK